MDTLFLHALRQVSQLSVSRLRGDQCLNIQQDNCLKFLDNIVILATPTEFYTQKLTIFTDVNYNDIGYAASIPSTVIESMKTKYDCENVEIYPIRDLLIEELMMHPIYRRENDPEYVRRTVFYDNEIQYDVNTREVLNVSKIDKFVVEDVILELDNALTPFKVDNNETLNKLIDCFKHELQKPKQ